MLDDDIQYIGTKPAQNLFPSDPFFQSPQIVTGIILRVEKSADDPACVLTFRRSNTSVVHIGRRPSNEERIQTDNDGAMFRCAVVSRKHAKIAFSDSGCVHLIDMKSHHGTHIRKPGETVSRMVVPETSTKLADGDVLTFGKSVGRHNEYVRPVVAQVELIYSPLPEVAFKPLTPVKHITVDLTKSPPQSSSGRYGVYSPSSDNVSPVISDQDSDVEEIPASGPNALPLQPRGSRNSESHLGRALEALKKLLPPTHIPNTGLTPESRSAEADFSSHVWQPSPLIFDTPPRFEFDSPLYSPVSPAWSDDPHSPSYGNRSRSPVSYIPSFFDREDSHDIGHASPNEHGSEEEYSTPERSRSTSPMDLASPSPIAVNRSLSPEQPAPQEPSVIGAWPHSPSPSRQRSSSPAPIGCITDVDVPPLEPAYSPPVQKAMSIGSICSEPLSQPQENMNVPIEQSVDIVHEEIKADNEGHGQKVATEVNQLQAALKKLQNEVAKLQTHRRKYKARFNTNVHLISDKLTDLDERVSDVNAQYTMLVDRVDDAADIDIPDLQAQVEALRDQAEHLPTMSEPFLHEREDVKASIETLRELVTEMRSLQENTQRQMSAELEAVRVARDAALARIAALAKTQRPALAPTSLKRKRSDDDDDETDEDRQRVLPSPPTENDVGPGDTIDATMAEVAAPTTNGNITPMACHHDHYVPPQKRARMIATVAAQTITAVTVGAIATWSALAFS